ncbi:hypothetical protein [Candidatus Borrarchaeum sp.]|uniref:hypothetical protein n=1 Tax=Candidatus Borrarchaeum sp. TaxID=2846742 RepID=UPI00257D7FFA|nr:hypothetical protein [Candidatus Borrarchaeum sp.]
MVFKNVPGTTTKWFIDVLEAKPGSLHSHIYVGIRKDGEEKQIFLDSIAYLVDLLVREFEDGRNFIGLPPLTTKRAVKTIADYFNLGDDFSSDLEYEYLRFIKEEGLPGPSVMITAREITEIYERSSQLKSKIYATKATTDEVLEEAMEQLESEDEDAQEK